MQASSIGTRLSLMMFLQFFIWGAWYVTAGNFLGVMQRTHDVDAWNLGAWVYGACPIAAMVSPLFLGMLADRFFASQKVLAAMHGLGAGLMVWIAVQVTGEEPDPELFSWTLLAYALCYMPTMGLTNTVAFTHIVDQARQFPMIRVFGTIGWIAANYLVSQFMEVDVEGVTVQVAAQQFWVAAGASVLLAGFSMTLPNTPPPLAGKQVGVAESLGLGALQLMKKPSFAVFIICSFLVCIPLMAYYAKAPVFLGESDFANPAASMANGQIAEVLFMLIMPLMFARLGVKWMLGVGMLAWVIRYGLFSYGAGDSAEMAVAWMLMGGILLHGICYDFFFVTGQIYVDKVAPAAIRGQAQGFLVLMTLGLGSWVGAHAAGSIEKAYESPVKKERVAEIGRLDARIKPLAELPQASPAQLEQLDKLRTRRRVAAAEARTDWGSVWAIPAWGAGGVLFLFLLLFRGRREDTAG